MSKTAREKLLKKVSKRAQHKSLLPSIDREYTFYELAVATRAGQAKCLGLKDKGHLGVGADADIAIYNINPEQVDPSKQYKRVRKAFKHAAYTIKDGKIAVKDGQVVKAVEGRTFWVKPKLPDPEMEITPRLKEVFEDYYTVQYENYIVPDHHLAHSHPIPVKPEAKP